MSGPETITLAGLPRGQLEALTEQLLAEKAALKQAVAELRAEVASLKGLKGRPRMKPSGMDQATEPGFAAKGQGRGAKGSKSERLRVDKEQVIKAAVPAGSRFKGYQDFLIQDLVLRPCVVRIRRERWLTPDGRTVVAPLPAGIVGHFGPELRRFALFPYHQGQVTVPRLVAQLGAVGIAISKRRVVRLLDEGQGIFLDAARDVLRAGLATAPLPAPSSRRPSAARTGSTALRAMDQRRRHRRPASAPQRGPHPARQRPFRRVCRHRFEEPAELPRAAAGRLPRSRAQRRGPDLHAPALPGGSGDRAVGRASRAALSR